jgi:hypothetical protein
LVAGGEHEDGSLFGFAQLREQLPAVEFWQHDIENDGVVTVGFGAEQTVLAVFGGIDGVALLAQSAGKAAQQVRFVFHDENSHGDGDCSTTTLRQH